MVNVTRTVQAEIRELIIPIALFATLISAIPCRIFFPRGEPLEALAVLAVMACVGFAIARLATERAARNAKPRLPVARIGSVAIRPIHALAGAVAGPPLLIWTLHLMATW
jgi:hypothetical protein